MGVWPLEKDDHSPEQEAGWGAPARSGAIRSGRMTKDPSSRGILQSPGPRRPLKDGSAPGFELGCPLGSLVCHFQGSSGFPLVLRNSQERGITLRVGGEDSLKATNAVPSDEVMEAQRGKETGPESQDSDTVGSSTFHQNNSGGKYKGTPF